MLTVIQRKAGKNTSLALKEVKVAKNLWVDCFKPTSEVIREISKELKFPYVELRDHMQRYERPSIYEFEDYSVVVLGVPVMDNKMSRASVSFFLHPGKNVFTMRMRDSPCIDLVQKEVLEKNSDVITSPIKLLRRVLERVVDEYFEQQDQFQEISDKIEHRVMNNPDKTSAEDLFKLKKQLLLSHKALVANREVILSIEKGRVGKISKQEAYEFRDVYNDIVQLLDANDTLRDVATGILDIYVSSVSNQLNISMKKLTVMASYVMIPTLIASIYGMNFKHMPEIMWKYGYPFSIGVMLISVIVMYIYFKKVKWV